MSVVVKGTCLHFDENTLKSPTERGGFTPPSKIQYLPPRCTPCRSCQCCSSAVSTLPRMNPQDFSSNEGKQEFIVILPCERCTPTTTTVYINFPLQGQIPPPQSTGNSDYPCMMLSFPPKHVPAPNNPMIQGGLLYCGISKVIPVIPQTFYQLKPAKPSDTSDIILYTP